MAAFVSSSRAHPVKRSAAHARPTPGAALAPSAPLLQTCHMQSTQMSGKRASGRAFAASQTISPEAAVIPGDELIELTKQVVEAGFGAGNGDNLSDDMIFRGPVIGPLPKEPYVAAISSFKVKEAFPDIETKSFGYSIDPTDPYRVWFFTQTTGTHTGDFNFAGSVIPPTGGKIQNGTEANSVIWTPDRKVKYISVGYCVDRINSNTPNGTMKVAVLGFLRATGKEGLWSFVTSPVVEWAMNIVNKLQGKPSTKVAFEDLPDWWKKLPDADLRGAENYTK